MRTPEKESPKIAIVHPGTLPGSAYGSLIDALRPYESVLFDIGRDRAFSFAAIDPAHKATSIKQLAKPLIQALDHGDIAIVVGWSFGGLVASMALAKSQVKAPLVLLDTIAPVEISDSLEPILAVWFGDYLAWRAGRELDVGKETVRDQGFDALFEPAREAGAIPADSSKAGFDNLAKSFMGGQARNVTMTAATLFQFPDEVFLIKPTRSLLPTVEDNFWSQHVDTIHYEFCVGTHYTMIDAPEAVQHNAAVIKKLAQVQPDS